MNARTCFCMICATVLPGWAPAEETCRFPGALLPALRQAGWELGTGCRSTADGLITAASGDVIAPWGPGAAQEVTAVLQPLERAGSSYVLAGLKIAADARFSWVLQLVESPQGTKYVELGETLAGMWQAQNTGSSKLEFRQETDDGIGWEYGRDYQLTIQLGPDNVRGRVIDTETGKTVFSGVYEFGSAMAVTRGRPAISTRGCLVLARNMSRQVLKPANTAGAATLEAGITQQVIVVSGGGPRSAGGTDAVALAQTLRLEGVRVIVMAQDGLGAPGLLRADRVQAVLLTDGSHVLAEHAGRLLRYCSSGGTVITVGGATGGETVHRLGEDWLALPAWADSQTMLNHPERRVLLDFERDLGGHWKRGSDQPDRAGTIRHMPRAGAGETGFARVETESVGSWDTYAIDLPELSDVAARSCLQLRARNTDGMTPTIAVELVEADGSRWIAKADIGRDWTNLLLRPEAFHFWESIEGRGEGDDVVRLNNVVRLSIGLAVTHVPVIGPSHIYDIDEIAVIPDLLSGAPTAVDLDAPMMIRTYAEDHMAALPLVRSAPDQSLMAGFELRGSLDGDAALPLVSPGEGDVTPLLSGFDRHKRRRGNLGCLVRYREGLFAGGTRVAFTCTNQDIFANAENRQSLVHFCRRLLDHSLPEAPMRQESRPFVASATPFPGNMPRLRVSADRQHLETIDGKRFFAIGANYHGYFDRCWGEYLDQTFDPQLIEADFRKLHAAGVNTLRIFFYRLGDDIRAEDWHKIDAVLELAQHHGLYLLVHLFGHDSTDMQDVLDVNRRLVHRLRGNPVVLGYDLRNEPTIPIMNRFKFPAANRPLAHTDYLLRHAGTEAEREYEKVRVPEMYSPLFSYEEATHAALFGQLFSRFADRYSLYRSTFRSDPFIPFQDDTLWQQVRHVAENLLETYITIQADVVRQEDPDALVTVGHNWAVDFLDANRHLDFISHHVYQRPRSHEFVLDNILTFDALREKWPDKPITYGEFGYTNGLGTPSGERLDDHASAVGEILHYLYPLAKGYSGSYKWMGNDPTGLRVSSPYEHMFGFFAYDGTLYGRAKPICYATRMLARYVARYGTGGQLDLLTAESPMPIAYVFHGNGGSLFVGGKQYEGDTLSYRNDTPTNVMLLTEDAGTVRVMASPDCTVRVRPQGSVASDRGWEASGNAAESRELADGWLELNLLDGEDVVIRPRR